MTSTTRKILAAGAFTAVIAGGAGVAAAATGGSSAPAAPDSAAERAEDAAEGPDTAISGDALSRASEAALAHTGEGRVTETEVGDEESYYEVEVTLDDGRQVDVQLDEQFNVVGDKVETGENG